MFFSQGRRRWLVRGVVRADRDRCLGGNLGVDWEDLVQWSNQLSALRDCFEFI